MNAIIKLDEYEAQVVKKAYNIRSAIDGFWHEMKRARSGIDGMDKMKLDKKTLKYVLDMLEFQLDENGIRNLFSE